METSALIVINETKNESCLSNGGRAALATCLMVAVVWAQHLEVARIFEKNGMLHKETGRCENLQEQGLELDGEMDIRQWQRSVCGGCTFGRENRCKMSDRRGYN